MFPPTTVESTVVKKPLVATLVPNLARDTGMTRGADTGSVFDSGGRILSVVTFFREDENAAVTQNRSATKDPSQLAQVRNINKINTPNIRTRE